MNLKKVGFYSFATSLMLGGILSCSPSAESIERFNESKEYIKKNAPDKYLGILEESDNIQFKNPWADNTWKIRYWEKQATAIRDSLRIDSIAKANYAKGLQMAKDTTKTIK